MHNVNSILIITGPSPVPSPSFPQPSSFPVLILAPTLTIQWGMVDFHNIERGRPQFRGDDISSPVNGGGWVGRQAGGRKGVS